VLGVFRATGIEFAPAEGNASTSPPDITGVSCKAGEVAATVFDRYRDDTYRKAG